jgi:hypothetical protein
MRELSIEPVPQCWQSAATIGLFYDEADCSDFSEAPGVGPTMISIAARPNITRRASTSGS